MQASGARRNRTIANVIFWSALLLLAIPFVLVKLHPSLQRVVNIHLVNLLVMFLEEHYIGPSFIICPLLMFFAVLLRICSRTPR